MFLRASVAAAAGTAAVGAGAGGAAAQDTEFDGWFDDVSNYDGVVDATGRESVTVRVGTEANGGAFGFDPAAVRVSPGTTVTWEWTGEGGSHNVKAEDADFESELTGEASFTFEHAFESEGVYRYACTPHRSLGMKGAVVVGSDNGEGGASAGDGGRGSDGVAVGELVTGLLAGALLTGLFLLPFSELRKHRANRR